MMCVNSTYLAWVPRICLPCALLLTHSVIAFGKFNPAASNHISVHHKPDNKNRLIKLKGFSVAYTRQLFG